MFEDNICRFIPQRNEPETIHTLNFVYEKNNPRFEKPRLLPSYRLHLVTKGSGVLNMPSQSFCVSEGDLFFVLPSAPYLLEGTEDFEYMYISFIGTRASHILDTLQIGHTNICFHDYGFLEPFWTEAILFGNAAFDLASEGVLLYTLSVLTSRLIQEKVKDSAATATASRIKKFIDEHLGDTNLSLELISDELSYNPKYISRIFKKEMRVSITDYINTIRIHHACTLMDKGFTSVQDISQLCGYRDPLYFSRVFKQALGIAPRKYVADLKSDAKK